MPLHALVLTLLGGVAAGLAADWLGSPPVKARRRMAALRSRVAAAHRRRVRRVAGALRIRRRADRRRMRALASAAMLVGVGGAFTFPRLLIHLPPWPELERSGGRAIAVGGAWALAASAVCGVAARGARRRAAGGAR